MASNEGKKNRTRPKRTRLNYFYLNDQLHKALNQNKGKDRLIAWNYPKGKRVILTYSDVLRRHEKAFQTGQVMKMLNRDRITFQRAFKSGMIERPPMTYTLDERRKPYQYMWREKDILAALDYFASVHIGRPRFDGQITAASDLPTPREVRAMIHDEQVLYVKQGDVFVPSWRAKEF